MIVVSQYSGIFIFLASVGVINFRINSCAHAVSFNFPVLSSSQRADAQADLTRWIDTKAKGWFAYLFSSFHKSTTTTTTTTTTPPTTTAPAKDALRRRIAHLVETRQRWYLHVLTLKERRQHAEKRPAPPRPPRNLAAVSDNTNKVITYGYNKARRRTTWTDGTGGASALYRIISRDEATERARKISNLLEI